MILLRQRMLEDMQVRNLSPHTQRAYIESVARFARHFGRSPVELGPEEIRSFQVYLTRERKLAPSSLGIAVCALRFLYRVTLKQPWSFDDLIPAPKKPRDSIPIRERPGRGVVQCVFQSPARRASSPLALATLRRRAADRKTLCIGPSRVHITLLLGLCSTPSPFDSNERVGGIRYTITDGIVYDAKRLLADVAAMVEAKKKGRTSSQ